MILNKLSICIFWIWYNRENCFCVTIWWWNFWKIANNNRNWNLDWKFISAQTWSWKMSIWWCDSKCHFFLKFCLMSILMLFVIFRFRWFWKTKYFSKNRNFLCFAMTFSSKKNKFNKQHVLSLRMIFDVLFDHLKNNVIDLYNMTRLLIYDVNFHIFWKSFVVFFIRLGWNIFKIVLIMRFFVFWFFFNFFKFFEKKFSQSTFFEKFDKFSKCVFAFHDIFRWNSKWLETKRLFWKWIKKWRW